MLFQGLNVERPLNNVTGPRARTRAMQQLFQTLMPTDREGAGVYLRGGLLQETMCGKPDLLLGVQMGSLS